MSHPRVTHPSKFLGAERKWNDIAANWVARIFGSPWCIWLFLITPLVVLLAPRAWKDAVFYLASGWIQLFALPLLTYVGNKAEALRGAKAQADHEALTHIAEAVDAALSEVTALRGQVDALTATKRGAP